jgi:hypothetical protein
MRALYALISVSCGRRQYARALYALISASYRRRRYARISGSCGGGCPGWRG